MKKGNKYTWGLCLLISLMVILTVLLVKEFNMKEILKTISNADKFPLAIGVALVLVHLFLGALVLKIPLRAMNQRISFFRCIKYGCIEVYYSAITPSATGGQPVQLIYMNKDGIPAATGTVVLLLVTVVYKFVLIGLGILSMVIDPKFVFTGNKLITVLFLLGIVINIAVIVFCLFLMYSKHMFRNIVHSVIAFLAKCKVLRHPDRKIERFDNAYREYHVGAQFIRENYGVTVKMTIVTIVQRVALFSVAYCVYKALGGGTEFRWIDFLTVQILVSTAVDSMPFPGGTVLSEALYGVIYGLVFASELVMPAMLLTRGISFYLYFAICAIVTLIVNINLLIKNRKGNKRDVIKS